MNQKGGKNIAFPTALLVIRILCIPELVSQLDINVWSTARRISILILGWEETKDKPTDVHCLKIQGLLSLSISHW